MQVLWDHHDPFFMFAGTDGGLLACIDVRSSSPVFTHTAHTSALSSLALSPSVSGCLVTVSDDQSMKVWDVRSHSCPHLVRQRLCKIGALHCAAACPDEPLVFCVGGDFEMKLINFHRDETVNNRFNVSDVNLTDNTASRSPSPEKPDTRKTKLVRRSSAIVSKSDKRQNTDHKASCESKQSAVGTSKVNRPKRLKNKDKKSAKS